MPAAALNIPPVPVFLTQVPAVCSPVIKVNKLIGVVSPSHILMLPSPPALAIGLTMGSKSVV